MRILGAIIAGGASRRFGSDKAAADLGGRPMIEHVITGLAPQVDALRICGRRWRDLPMLEDRPEPGLGPLGGLYAALSDAQGMGYDGVLCVPVDVLPIPAGLRHSIDDPGRPWVLERQTAIGYWPAALVEALDRYLAAGHRSINGWIAAAGAHRLAETTPLYNINDPESARLYLVDVEGGAQPS